MLDGIIKKTIFLPINKCKMKISDLFHSVHEFFNEKRFVIFTLSIIFLLFVTNLILSKGFTGGSESMWSYSYSHFAFSYPGLYFNPIAKPIFILLSAPFGFFGFKALQFFNILLALGAGLFSYLVAKELKMKQPILAIILCSFTPIFTYTVFSGLTEILFAFLAILSSYLFLKSRYAIGSIIVSALPLVNSVGIFLIPVYAFYLLYKKQYKPLALLFSSIILYSLFGGIINDDFFWLINQNPFFNKIGIYGTGNFFQFIKRSPGYFGIPNEIFYVTGLVAGVTLYLRNKKEFYMEFFLVFLPFVTYLFAHSFMWYTGIGNSQGNNSYMAAIVPLMAVMSTRGLTLFSLMFEILFKQTWVKTAALYIGIISVIHIPFAVQNYPIYKNNYDKLVVQTTDWIKESKLNDNRICIKDASICYYLGLNPFDTSRVDNLFHVKKDISKTQVGSIIIYDEKYFPVDGIEFDSLAQNNSFELLKVFEPETNFKVFGRDYRIAVFRYIKPDSLIVNQNRLIAYGTKAEYRTLVSYDFDRSYHKPDSAMTYFDDKSDTKCFKASPNNPKFLYKEFDLSTINFEKPLELYLSLKLRTIDTLKQPILFVVEVEKGEKRLFYEEIKLSLSDSLVNKWGNIEHSIKLNNEITFSGKLKTFFVNPNKSTYLLDDYRLGYCTKR